MTGRNSQRKGADFERKIAAELREAGFEDVRRGQVWNGEPDVVGVPGWHFELKKHKRTSPKEWWEQAEKDAAKMRDGVPAVVFQWDYGKPMVMITFKTFLALIGKGEK